MAPEGAEPREVEQLLPSLFRDPNESVCYAVYVTTYVVLRAISLMIRGEKLF